MGTLKRWLLLLMIAFALALSGCGAESDGESETDSEQVLPGAGGEGGEGGEGDWFRARLHRTCGKCHQERHVLPYSRARQIEERLGASEKEIASTVWWWGGIAMVLGEAGATVYVTGRSIRSNSTRDELPGTTIDDTAAMVTGRGGIGIPVRVDHTNDADIATLFRRVQQEQGRLDLLVNNAWGGYADDEPEISFDAVFWEQPVRRCDTMFQAGLRATLVTTHAALPLMIPRRSGLIVNMTLDIAPDHYDQALFYLRAKATINYLTRGMARDLNQRGALPIAVVGL